MVKIFMINNKKKLSIITVNLNNSHGLRATLSSVFSQTFQDMEIIIVDGASIDDSYEIIKEYEKLFNISYTWISEPDTGVFNAMNKGIRMSSGEYLLFLNSGDFLTTPNVINDVFNESHNTEIICCRCRVSQNEKKTFVISPPNFFSFGFFYTNSLSHQATFIKKDLFNKYGLYREDLKIMSDWEFFIRVIIIECVSTSNSTIILSDYNLNGMSSLHLNQQLIKSEKQIVFDCKPIVNFIKDYELFVKNNETNIIMNWYWSKIIFRIPLFYVYKFIFWTINIFNRKHNESLK
ncbi:glycosyltransferase family 2 protein [Paludibacter sp.]